VITATTTTTTTENSASCPCRRWRCGVEGGLRAAHAFARLSPGSPSQDGPGHRCRDVLGVVGTVSAMLLTVAVVGEIVVEVVAPGPLSSIAPPPIRLHPTRPLVRRDHGQRRPVGRRTITTTFDEEDHAMQSGRVTLPTGTRRLAALFGFATGAAYTADLVHARARITSQTLRPSSDRQPCDSKPVTTRQKSLTSLPNPCGKHRPIS
jgi:hypothetical protein